MSGAHYDCITLRNHLYAGVTQLVVFGNHVIPYGNKASKLHG